MQNKVAIRKLIVANAISHFAQGISMIAIPWYFVHHLDAQETYNAMFLIVAILTFFWSPYAGTLIDRFPRKNVMMGLCMVGFSIVGGAAIIGFITQEVSVLVLSVVFGFTILNFNLHYPALYAWTQEMTSGKEYGRINSLLEIQGQATTMLAGATAIFLIQGLTQENMLTWGLDYQMPFEIQPWSIHEIFLLDACTYLVAILIIRTITYQSFSKKSIDEGSLKERFNNGITFLKKNPSIFKFGAFSYAVFVVLILHSIMLLPNYVSNYLESDGATFALADVFYTLGALSAGIGVRKLFKKTHAINGIIILMLVCVGVCFTLGLTQSKWSLFAMSILFGICNSGVRVLRVTFLFEHIPNNTIGRVSSIFQSLNLAGRASLSALFLIPFFVDDVSRAYLVEGSFVLICTVFLAVNAKKIKAHKIVA